MLSSRNQPGFVAYVRSYAKSGLILPGQVLSVWDPSDPTSKQMANYFTHPDQIPVSKGEKLDNAIEACDQLKMDKRQIHIKAVLEDEFFFSIRNTSLTVIVLNNSVVTTPKDTLLHWYGLQNVKTILSR